MLLRSHWDLLSRESNPQAVGGRWLISAINSGFFWWCFKKIHRKRWWLGDGAKGISFTTGISCCSEQHKTGGEIGCFSFKMATSWMGVAYISALKPQYESTKRFLTSAKFLSSLWYFWAIPNYVILFDLVGLMSDCKSCWALLPATVPLLHFRTFCFAFTCFLQTLHFCSGCRLEHSRIVEATDKMGGLFESGFIFLGHMLFFNVYIFPTTFGILSKDVQSVFVYGVLWEYSVDCEYSHI